MLFPLDCMLLEARGQIWLRLGQLIWYWELNEALVMMEDIGAFWGGGESGFFEAPNSLFPIRVTTLDS